MIFNYYAEVELPDSECREVCIAYEVNEGSPAVYYGDGAHPEEAPEVDVLSYKEVCGPVLLRPRYEVDIAAQAFIDSEAGIEALLANASEEMENLQYDAADMKYDELRDERYCGLAGKETS